MITTDHPETMAEVSKNNKITKTLLLSHTLINVQMVDKNVHHLITSPFKTVYFQIFYKTYCCRTIEAKTMKKVLNQLKVICTTHIECLLIRIKL